MNTTGWRVNYGAYNKYSLQGFMQPRLSFAASASEPFRAKRESTAGGFWRAAGGAVSPPAGSGQSSGIFFENFASIGSFLGLLNPLEIVE